MQISSVFNDLEGLCRIVFNPPGFQYFDENGVTSAVFKRRKNEGTSVDRFHRRNIYEVLEYIVERKSTEDFSAFFIVTTSMCEFKEQGDEPALAPAILVYSPTRRTENEKENLYHSEIYKSYNPESKNGEAITKGQAKRLARNCFPISIETAVSVIKKTR